MGIVKPAQYNPWGSSQIVRRYMLLGDFLHQRMTFGVGLFCDFPDFAILELYSSRVDLGHPTAAV